MTATNGTHHNTFDTRIEVREDSQSEARAEARTEAQTLQAEARAAAHALIPNGETLSARAKREGLEKRLFGKAPALPTAKASVKAADTAEGRYVAECSDLGIEPDVDVIGAIRRAAEEKLQLGAEKRGARHALGMTGLRYLRSPRQ